MLRRAQLISCVLLITSCASAARAQATTTQRDELQKQYVGYLKSEGYSPEITGGGDVAFKYQGAKYAIVIDPKDPKYFRVVLVWKPSADQDRSRALEAANKAGLGTKVAKVLVTQEAVIVAAEFFLKDPSDFSAIMTRALGSIQVATRTYFEEMGKK